MTLYNIIEELKNIAINKPNINYVGEGDIYILNSLPNIDYSVFFITQGNHVVDMDRNVITYSLNLFYIDRLFDDASNRLIVQSNGIDSLMNIINAFVGMNEDVVLASDIRFTSFNQRFADDCCGVFCTLDFEVENNIGLCSYE